MKMLGKAHIDTAARLGMDLQWKLPSSPWVGRVCALPHGKGGPWWGPAVEVRWAYVSSAPSRTGVRQWMLSNKFYDLALLSRKISSFCEESDEQGESESIAVSHWSTETCTVWLLGKAALKAHIGHVLCAQNPHYNPMKWVLLGACFTGKDTKEQSEKAEPLARSCSYNGRGGLWT